MVGTCHLNVRPQPSDKKPEEIRHGGGLNGAEGKMALSYLGPDEEGRGDIRTLTRPRGLGQSQDRLQKSPSLTSLHTAAKTQLEYS